MKKILLLVLILLSIFLGYSFKTKKTESFPTPLSKQEILKVALVADSHNENELLAKALAQSKEQKVDFVIGLGDYTNLGSVDELSAAKKVVDDSGLQFFSVPGDRDGWENRERGEENTTNFKKVFNLFPSQVYEKNAVQFVMLNNSDLYKGISSYDWQMLDALKRVSTLPAEPPTPKLRFVFAHKTPFHPDSAHIMGEDSPAVAKQAEELLTLLENNKVDGFFSGDIHFFSQFHSPSGSVKITTIGAVARGRNFQGPRFAILKVYSDYSWEVEDIPIN